MKRNSFLKKTIGVSSIVVFLFACDQEKRRTDEAYQLLYKGELDAALKNFQLLYKNYPQSPRVMAGMGRLLSLKRISVFAGMELLQKSLKYKPDKELWQELAIAYIAMGHPEYVKEMIRSDILATEEAFDPQTSQLRSAADCIYKPSTAKLKKLAASQEKARGNFYHFMCELAVNRKSKDSSDLLSNYYKIPRLRDRCETLSVWRSLADPPPDFLQKEQQLCKQKLPGLIAIHREAFLLPKREDILQLRRPPIFDIDPFAPLDPGAEGLKAPWQLLAQEQDEQEQNEQEQDEQEQGEKQDDLEEDQAEPAPDQKEDIESPGE